jgi:ABC-type dipeptide/oligopeptide/nickel transport system permease component
MILPFSRKMFLNTLQFLIVILGILTLLFFLQRLTGDPAAVLVGHNATPELLAAVREEMGLNHSLPVQYMSFLGKIAQLDFGTSTRFEKPALEMVMLRFPNTVLLSVSAMMLALSVGVPVGIYAALYHRRADGILINLFASVLQSLPSFWLGLMILLVFSVHLGWFGSVSHLEEDPVRRMVLPTVTLSAFYIARLIRLVRSGVIEELNRAYVLTAHAKGLAPRHVLFIHALKNALIPVVSFVTLDLSFMIGGSIVVENLFSYSGMGDQMVRAIFNRDYALVQASMFVIVLLVVSINVASNRIFTIIDPRIRA